MSTCYYIERLGGYARVWTPGSTDRRHARWRACGADRRERTRKEVSASFSFFFSRARRRKKPKRRARYSSRVSESMVTYGIHTVCSVKFLG
jgi:hypothetical protein